MGSQSTATFGVFFLCGIVVLIQLPMLARSQLPCTHPLRIAAPELFTHCGAIDTIHRASTPCTYTSWGSWRRVPGGMVSVPVGQCPSGKAYTEERTRTARISGCSGPLRETQSICECIELSFFRVFTNLCLQVCLLKRSG